MKENTLSTNQNIRKSSYNRKRNVYFTSFNIDSLQQRPALAVSARIEDIVKKEFSKIRKD